MARQVPALSACQSIGLPISQFVGADILSAGLAEVGSAAGEPSSSSLDMMKHCLQLCSSELGVEPRLPGCVRGEGSARAAAACHTAGRALHHRCAQRARRKHARRPEMGAPACMFANLCDLLRVCSVVLQHHYCAVMYSYSCMHFGFNLGHALLCCPCHS